MGTQLNPIMESDDSRNIQLSYPYELETKQTEQHFRRFCSEFNYLFHTNMTF